MSKNKKKSNWLKPVGIAFLAGTLMLSADKYDISTKIVNTYNSAKAKVEDVITYDASERAKDFVDKLNEEDDLSENYAVLEETILDITHKLPENYQVNILNEVYNKISIDAKYNLISIDLSEIPDSSATNMMKNRISNLDDSYKKEIITNLSKEVINTEKEKFSNAIKNFYESIKNEFSKEK